jgi:uncharacterized protein (TIGR03437 family)
MIEGNNITRNVAAANGGGVALWSHASDLVRKNTIAENSADGGAGIMTYNYSSSVIEANNIISNFATKGGGIAIWTHSSDLISGNSFVGNVATTWGGSAVHVWDFSSPTISGNIISGNMPASQDPVQCLAIDNCFCTISNNNQSTLHLLSAASFLDGQPLAPGSIASVMAHDVASETASASSSPLPTTLADTTVSVTDRLGTERLAPLFFVSPSQINWLVPEQTSYGAATVTVTSRRMVMGMSTLQVAAVAPALFAANANGSGVAAAQWVRVSGGGQTWGYVFQADAPEGKRNSVPIDLGPDSDQVFLVLYGTGIRGLSSLTNVSVTIGGVDAKVTYAGPQGGSDGLDQVNVLLPRSLTGRGGVDIMLKVDGRAANTVTVSIK